MSNLISIIIPVYNSETNIRECLESVLNQDYDNTEIIIVNDGSTDGTEKICREYSASNEHIHLFFQENQGVSSARNLGLTKANGKYILFLDSDDLLVPNTLHYRITETENSDLFITSHQTINEGWPIKSIKNGNNQIFNLSNEEMLSQLFTGEKMGYQGYIWNKVFKRDIIEKYAIRFKPGIAYNEDRLFVVQYLSHCSKIKYSDRVTYFYRNTPGSAMNTNIIKDESLNKFMTEFLAFDEMKKILYKKYPDAYVQCCHKTFLKAYQYIDIAKKNNATLIKKRLKKIMRSNLPPLLIAKPSIVIFKAKIKYSWLTLRSFFY